MEIRNKNKEYTDTKVGIQIFWSDSFGWSSYTLDGDVIERLTGADVDEFLTNPDYHFIARPPNPHHPARP